MVISGSDISVLMSVVLRCAQWRYVALAANQLLEGKKATGHPMFQQPLNTPDSDAVVVVDGNCITSQGAGTALEFALSLVEILFNRVRRDEVASAMVVHVT